MRIGISPDENPGDSGSVAADGTTERSVNLRVAGALQVALQRCQQDVWFDPTITYDQRVARANGDGTELLVACAHNDSTAGDSGTLFVFCNEAALSFGKQAAAADAVYAELATIPGWPARRPNAIVPVDECCLFNNDTVYVELLFMSPEDERIWSRPSYPQDAAEAIARGLAKAYGFAYVPPGQPAPAPGPEPADPSAFWWGPYVTGADQVVELNSPCHANVWEAGGTWYRDMDAVQPAVLGEYAEWTLANRVSGVWYVMDLSGGPQGMGPVGRVAPADSWWIEDSVTDSTGCSGNNPPAVALSGKGRWYSVGGAKVAEPAPAHLVAAEPPAVPPARPHLDVAEAALRRAALNLASSNGGDGFGVHVKMRRTSCILHKGRRFPLCGFGGSYAHRRVR